jgi:MFS family permease
MASVISNVGGFFQSVAAAWLMLEMTGSPVWVSAMAASTTLPLLFLALPAGAFADLANRRNVLLVSQLGMGGVVTAMAVVVLVDAATPALLLSLGLLLGVGVALNAPVWQALVPDLVPRQLVASAVALNSASFNAARAVGPALAGLVVVTLGAGAAFAINAGTYLAVIAVVASFPAGDWGPQEHSPLVGAMALGIRYARFTPVLRWLLALAAAFALTSAALQTLLPNLTQDALKGGAVMYGVLLGAMGAGALVGAMTRERFGGEMGRRTVPLAMAMYGAMGVGVGLARLPWLGAVLMAGAGVCWVWGLTTLNATIQNLSHSWVRGRAMSLYMLAFSGVLPLGSLLAGAVADRVGVAWAVVGLSAGAVAVGLSALRLPIIGFDEVEVPRTADDWELTPHGELEVLGGPVLVMNTFVIDEDRLDEFMEVLAELRLVRLRTGAYRWRLYRNVDNPNRMTEAFSLASWEEHLRQHSRMDASAVDTIKKARAFDVAGGPVGRHLVAFDVSDPRRRPEWSELVARHGDAHRTDGSIPLLGVEAADRDGKD